MQLIPKDSNKIYVSTIAVKKFLFVLIAVLVIVGIIFYSPALSNGARADKIEKQRCKNFSTQPQAQRIYEKFINDPQYSKTVKAMDADHDGIACENLPIK